jgi:hypothetical protein
MLKFLLNLLLQISKALINSKIQFLIQKSFFLAFGPANLAARSASSPASPPVAPSPQAETVPAGPSSPRVGRIFTGNTFSLSDHVFPSAAASPFYTTVARPPQRRPSSGDTQAVFPSLPSPLCAPAGELWRTGAAGGQAPMSAPPCPLSAPPWLHGAPPDRPRSTVRGPGARD